MNNPAFSIIATLRETLQLTQRYLKLMLVVSIIAAVPSICEEFGLYALSPAHYGWVAFLSLSFMAVLFVVGALKTSALLGVLKQTQNDATLWSVASTSMRTYTWALVRLSFLLTLIACIFTFPIGFLMSVLLMSPKSYALQLILVFVAILYLVFVKYALADPLIVVEGMGALPALKRSWQMTKGCFGYVLGCYVFLGTAEYFLTSLFQHFEIVNTFKFVNLIDQLVTSLFECLWVLMAWCMYHRIKAVGLYKDEEELSGESSAT